MRTVVVFHQGVLLSWESLEARGEVGVIAIAVGAIRNW